MERLAEVLSKARRFCCSTLTWYGITFGIVVGFCIWWAQRSEQNQETAVGSLLSFFGVFFGAGFAFHLNTAEKKQALFEEQIAAVNHALFVLARQRNVAKQMYSEFIKIPDEVSRPFILHPFKIPPASALDLRKIDFFVAEDPDLAFRLLIEEDRFSNAIFSLEQRNKFFVELFQPALEKSGLANREVEFSALRKELGDLVFDTAIRTTDQSFILLREFLGSSLAMQTEIRKFAKARYPGRKFIAFF